jgi:hypothetical protein
MIYRRYEGIAAIRNDLIKWYVYLAQQKTKRGDFVHSVNAAMGVCTDHSPPYGTDVL